MHWKKYINRLILILIILSVMFNSCAHRYYSDYPGKVTKGYKKAPKRWEQPKSRYISPDKK